MMLERKDIAWLAGLLEGEGSFICVKSSPTRPGNYAAIRITVQMTDEDVIQRAAQIMGTKVYQRKQIEGKKTVWGTATSGSSRAAGWMMTLYSLMGKRRQARILECLQIWKEKVTPRIKNRKSICHPTEKYEARGMCRRCYGHWHYQNNKEQYTHKGLKRK
jgi:hypothetical protein